MHEENSAYIMRYTAVEWIRNGAICCHPVTREAVGDSLERKVYY